MVRKNRKWVIALSLLLLGIVSSQSQQVKAKQVVLLTGSDALAVSSAIRALKTEIEKKSSLNSYVLRVETYEKEKVVQLLADGPKMGSLPSYAVRCDLSGSKVLRIYVQQ